MSQIELLHKKYLVLHFPKLLVIDFENNFLIIILVVSCQMLVISCKLSIASYQLLVISYQLLVISYQLLVISF